MSHPHEEPLDKPLPSPFIEFILSGRRTRSEHLPAENITVCLDVVKRSPYLESLMLEQTVGVLGASLFLRDVDLPAFRLYLCWLETGMIKFEHHPLFKYGGLALYDCADLIYAHILGIRFAHYDFSDAVIDSLELIVDVIQSPDMRVLEIIFLEDHVTDTLKRLLTDKMFAMERRIMGLLRGSSHEVRSHAQGSVNSQSHDRSEEIGVPSCAHSSLHDDSSVRPSAVRVQDHKGVDIASTIPEGIAAPGKNGITLINVCKSAHSLDRRGLPRQAYPHGAMEAKLDMSFIDYKPMSVTFTAASQSPHTERLVALEYWKGKEFQQQPMSGVQKNIHIQIEERPQHIASQAEISKQEMLDFSKQSQNSALSARRKPAPVRGLDWLAQYELVNGMHAVQPR